MVVVIAVAVVAAAAAANFRLRKCLFACACATSTSAWSFVAPPSYVVHLHELHADDKDRTRGGPPSRRGPYCPSTPRQTPQSPQSPHAIKFGGPIAAATAVPSVEDT